MRLPFAALLLATAAPALGAATGAVLRGDFLIPVKVEGTVVAEDVYRLKSTLEGRVEGVNMSSGAWRGADEPLAMLADKELAAMIDARGARNPGSADDHWSRLDRPTPVRCPAACYVLKVYAKARSWVKPRAVLFEVASRLKMVGRVRPEDAPLLRAGMTLTFWDVADPKRRLTVKLERSSVDIGGGGATVALFMAPGRTLGPGTQWEGEIPVLKTSVLTVPTAALIVHDGGSYLPIRVSTGARTVDFTQITEGADENRQILILGDSALRGAARQSQSADRAVVPSRPSAAEERPPATDEDYGGEDPYGGQ